MAIPVRRWPWICSASRVTAATIGIHYSHEQQSPSQLLAHVRLAADAGFRDGMCSDHFHPWLSTQQHSGFAWSWLGAALATSSLSFGTVCAPGQRYHPAVIAQAAATLAEMFPDRFWLAVGSGEALNEHITGDPWPVKAVRDRRLRECVDVMRALWAGDTVTHRGLVTVVDARLHTRSAQPPMLVGAALSPMTARWVATWADALITVAGPRDAMRSVVDAFREGGGEHKPMFLQVALSCAPTDEESRQAALAWRQAALSTDLLANLANPDAFDRATLEVARRDVLGRVRASADPGRLLATLREDAALGFSRLYLHNVAAHHQERFIDACATAIIPAFTHR